MENSQKLAGFRIKSKGRVFLPAKTHIACATLVSGSKAAISWSRTDPQGCKTTDPQGCESFVLCWLTESNPMFKISRCVEFENILLTIQGDAIIDIIQDYSLLQPKKRQLEDDKRTTFTCLNPLGAPLGAPLGENIKKQKLMDKITTETSAINETSAATKMSDTTVTPTTIKKSAATKTSDTTKTSVITGASAAIKTSVITGASATTETSATNKTSVTTETSAKNISKDTVLNTKTETDEKDSLSETCEKKKKKKKID
eukprot:GHVL01043672.1.p2 GENE.GHVL01043672.1~~GHVL01043672.1.p2  ORF type:complete len:258 (-),score=95.11 GHVL01043672.1:3095-3868(-)